MSRMYQQALKGKAIQLKLWQSDQSIVSMKQGNACGEKGLTRMRLEARDTSSALRGGQKMSTKLASITLRAKENPNERFTSLAHLLNEDFLKECFRELKKNKAPGIDGVSVEEYGVKLGVNIKDLVNRLKSKRYRPQPVRRVYIPKPNGGKRPLGIPAVEDKIVQMGIKKILEAIFEVDFLDVSFGFRPNKSPHDALDVLDKTIMTKPINFVVDMDIEKFFDTVNHKWLMEFLRRRIADRSLLQLIGRFLRCGVVEEGKFVEIDKGTPQGCILSPLLANVYLHYVLDLWFEKKIRERMAGFVKLIRYADDFIVCFQSGHEAKKFGVMLKERLAKFGLRVAEDKSRIIEFGRYVWQRAMKERRRPATFNFLGFTHYCDKTMTGKFKLGRRTDRTRLWRKIKEINTWLKRVRNFVKLKDWWEVLRLKLVGHYNYYAISGNIASVKRFYNHCVSLVFKWINRRNDRRSCNWEEFNRFLSYNPLPRPRIYRSMYTLSSRGCILEEPNALIGHVRFCGGQQTP